MFRAHLDSLLEYCRKGVEEGATLVYGGKQVDGPGMTPAFVCYKNNATHESGETANDLTTLSIDFACAHFIYMYRWLSIDSCVALFL